MTPILDPWWSIDKSIFNLLEGSQRLASVLAFKEITPD
jgi:hypothetical protein